MTSSASSGTHNGVLTRMCLEMRDSGGILRGNRYVHYLFRGGYKVGDTKYTKTKCDFTINTLRVASFV